MSSAAGAARPPLLAHRRRQPVGQRVGGHRVEHGDGLAPAALDLLQRVVQFDGVEDHVVFGAGLGVHRHQEALGRQAQRHAGVIEEAQVGLSQRVLEAGQRRDHAAVVEVLGGGDGEAGAAQRVGDNGRVGAHPGGRTALLVLRVADHQRNALVVGKRLGSKGGVRRHQDQRNSPNGAPGPAQHVDTLHLIFL
nr:hypothetical protein [Azospirillum brasilense]